MAALPPEVTDDPLFQALAADRARDLLDAAGRPLGERSSPLYPPDTSERACPYAGSRRGRPMNVSAMRQITTHWAPIGATLRAFAGPDATVHRAWRAATAATAAPVIFSLAHPEASIPVPLAALYKAGLGYTQVLATMLLADDGVADAPMASLGVGDDLLAFLEGGGWLVGDAQACAGPPAMIAELYGALCGEGAAVEGPTLFDDAGITEAELDRAVEHLALQVAAAIGAWCARRDGRSPDPLGARLLDHGTASLLRVVPAAPNRQPAHAARLFERGVAPTSLARFVAALQDET